MSLPPDGPKRGEFLRTLSSVDVITTIDAIPKKKLGNAFSYLADAIRDAGENPQLPTATGFIALQRIRERLNER